MSFTQSDHGTGVDPRIGVKAFRAGGWLISMQLLGRGLGLVQRVVLARLLAPNDFGEMGVALLLIGGTELISNPALSASLVQKRGDVNRYIGTYFTAQLTRALVIYPAFFLAAPFLCGWLGAPEATSVGRGLAFVMIIRAFRNPGMILLDKNLNFRPRTILEFAASATGTIASIVIALVLQNAWALVAGILSTAAVETVLSYVVCRNRAELGFDAKCLKDMMGFGTWIWASSILVYAATQGDDIIVSRLLGPAQLAFYQMAFWLANLPATHFVNATAQVTFPAYARMQQEPARLRAAFFSTVRVVLAVSVPFAVMILTMAVPVTHLLLGDQWLPMCDALRVFAVSGLLRALSACTGAVLLALGKPSIDTVGQFVRVVILALTIWYATSRWGTAGAAGAVTLSSMAMVVLFWTKVMALLDGKVVALVGVFAPVLAGGLAMAWSIHLLVTGSTANQGWLHITSRTAIAMIAYAVIVLLVDRWMDKGYIRSLHRILEAMGFRENRFPRKGQK